MTPRNDIGLLNEKPLHAALKQWYAQPGDLIESLVDGYVIDVVRDDLLIEIQSGNFSKIKQKVKYLAAQYPLRLVYPIAQEKWIIKREPDGNGIVSRRKSPKRGRVVDLFKELVSFPGMILEPNFSLEILLIKEEELRCYDEKRGWRRRGWVTEERRLLEVVDRTFFAHPEDFSALLPENLPAQFTTFDIADVLHIRRRLAQRMAYCLREMGEIVPVGKYKRAVLYSRPSE